LVGGLQEEAQDQKTIKIGKTRSRKMATKVFIPPFNMKVTRPGIPMSAAASRRLEKFSLPAPSAGRGAL
jgi:hypothetical protein